MKKRLITTLAVILCMGLSACVTMQPIPRNGLPPSTAKTSLISKAKQEAAALMKDPGSVQLRNVRGYDKDDPNHALICGEINAKNSFGGYTGFQQFTYVGGHIFLNKPAPGCLVCENPFNEYWNKHCK